MKHYFIDTNIFLSFFIEREGRQHRDCIQLFQKLEKNQIKGIICSVVLLEIYFTLKSFYALSNQKVRDYLAQVLDIRQLKFRDAYDYYHALTLYEKTGVKFNDCLIASLNIFPKTDIVSYDKDFDKLGIKRLEPVDILDS